MAGSGVPAIASRETWRLPFDGGGAPANPGTGPGVPLVLSWGGLDGLSARLSDMSPIFVITLCDSES